MILKYSRKNQGRSKNKDKVVEQVEKRFGSMGTEILIQRPGSAVRYYDEHVQVGGKSLTHRPFETLGRK